MSKTPRRASVVTLVGVVLAFVGATAVADWRMLAVDQETEALLGNALPSIEYLGDVNDAARDIETITDSFLDAGTDGRIALHAKLDARWRDVDTALARYRALPAFPGEPVLFAEVPLALRELDAGVRATVLEAELGEVDRARVDSDAVVRPRANRLTHVVRQIIRLNEAAAVTSATRINGARREAVALSVALTAIAVVLTAGAGALMVRLARSQDELVTARLALEERRTAEHEAARLSLEAADRGKDEFLAMLSHELRAPLAPICNSLAILERATPGDEQARRAESVIGRQVTHMTRLVDDLLDVTRISHGKLQLRAESLDFAAVVRRVADDNRSSFAATGVALSVSIPQGPIRIRGDGERVAQVIGNLLGNAAKFTSRGGTVTVTVERNEAPRQAVARVRDTGPGIAPEMLPQLFDPFVQAQGTLARSKGGLGLGLALVRRLVEMHGGTASAESEGLGKGAEFTVRFPLARDLPVASAPAAPARQSPVSRRVLVIDDNVDAAETLSNLLELEGHTVETVFTGQEGIGRARVFQPDVVLCDIGLPGMDGYEVARAMRADPALKSVVLVALTGYARPTDVARSKEAGFEHHLAKPPNIDQLVQILGRTSVESSPATL